MIDSGNVHTVRSALEKLPEGTSYGEVPEVEHVYLPRSHLKAMDPNRMVITGMRGAGKTFWWSALQERSVRQMVAVAAPGLSTLDANTEVRRGFGVDPATDDYPGRDELRLLMAQGVDPRMIWRTVQARQVADAGDPLRQDGNWHERVQYASDNPGRIDRLFQKCDEELQRRGVYFLILFDALDLCADDWQEMYRAIRGLL